MSNNWGALSPDLGNHKFHQHYEPQKQTKDNNFFHLSGPCALPIQLEELEPITFNSSLRKCLLDRPFYSLDEFFDA